jgi:thiol:disulfide interchange protein DsbC
MKYFAWLIFICLNCASATAQTSDPTASALKEKLSKNYGQLLGTIQQVNPTSAKGLFEVVTQDQILYVDESGQYLFDGNLVDLKARRNLTEERKRLVFAIDFSKLPLDLAVVKVKGNGKRKLAYFTDPNCGYCKKLEQELKKVNDVTLYLFLYPIFNGSAEKVEAIWCSKDRVKAWDDLMLNGIQPTMAKCNTPLAKVKELGARFHINGTPALIFSDGALVPGYLPAADLEKALNAAIQ